METQTAAWGWRSLPTAATLCSQYDYGLHGLSNHDHHYNFNYNNHTTNCYANANGNAMAMPLKSTERWVSHYSSSHKILLVGEGDFSFSLSLALSFGSASNIFATSLDPYEFLMIKYERARSNLEELRRLGATLLHSVDATEMKHNPLINMHKFDRIVFNFPHAGFYGKEDNPLLIKMHQELVRGFFCNARWLLRDRGEIHISHKTSPPYSNWNLEKLANENSLTLIGVVSFNKANYPYYEQKRGHGTSSGQTFELGVCSTFKFALPPPFALPSNNFSHVTSQQCRSYSYQPLLNGASTNSSSNSYYDVINSLPHVKLIVRTIVRHDVGGRTGYAGALVCQKGSVQPMFYGSLPYVLDSDVAEVHAIKHALLMFERLELSRNMKLIVESSSNCAISWILSRIGNPSELQALLGEVSMALKRLQNVQIQYTSAEGGVEHHHFVVKYLAEKGLYVNNELEALL